MPKNILQKKDDELDKLRLTGLSMLYVGIETGNDALLKKVTKGATSKGIIQSMSKSKTAWIYFFNSGTWWENIY